MLEQIVENLETTKRPTFIMSTDSRFPLNSSFCIWVTEED